MKISIKTLKGDMFQVDAEPTETVLTLKEKIAADKADFEVDRQKLIHSGKVLKDTATIEELAVSETDFIVCMVTAKPKAPTTQSQPTSSVTSSAQSSSSTSASTTQTAANTTTQAAPQTTSQTQSAPPAVVITPEAITSLVAMGFPEDECRAALQAAQGNAVVAVEFLMTGIPEAALAPQTQQQHTAPVAGGNDGLAHLEDFRRHPNFAQLQRLVQDNPNELNRVLNVIGSQNPALLAAIHENHDAFIAMMNEPINNTPAAPIAAPGTAATGGGGGFGGMPAGVNGAQMMQMIQGLPPAQRAMMAQSMGISPEQLNAVMQMMSTMPPEQLQQMMQGMGGMGGAAAAGGGQLPTGAHVVRLTEEEMASVTRLMELGFTQQQAAQAFLACDRNEALAANFLFEGGDDMMDDGYDGGHDDHNNYM